MVDQVFVTFLFPFFFSGLLTLGAKTKEQERSPSEWGDREKKNERKVYVRAHAASSRRLVTSWLNFVHCRVHAHSKFLSLDSFFNFLMAKTQRIWPLRGAHACSLGLIRKSKRNRNLVHSMCAEGKVETYQRSLFLAHKLWEWRSDGIAALCAFRHSFSFFLFLWDQCRASAAPIHWSTQKRRKRKSQGTVGPQPPFGVTTWSSSLSCGPIQFLVHFSLLLFVSWPKIGVVPKARLGQTKRREKWIPVTIVDPHALAYTSPSKSLNSLSLWVWAMC